MTGKGRFAATFLFAVLSSIVLLETGLGIFVFAIPLLVLAEKFQSKGNSAAVFCSAILAVVCMKLYTYWDLLTLEYAGVLFLDNLFPLMVLAESFAFVILKDKTQSFLRRLVLASRVTIVIGLACGLFLTSTYGAPVMENLSTALESTLGYVEELLGVDVSEFFIPYTKAILTIAPVPIGMLISGLQIWIASNLLHKNDQDWQMGFAYMKLPNGYAWLFMGLWALVAVTRTLKTIPSYVSVVAWNCALALSLHFFMNGVSVLTARLRRQSAFLTSGKVCLWIIIGTVIPGLDAVMFLGLTLVGVLEAWIKMR